MHSNAAMISLALAIAAAPSLAMPFPAGETEARAETLEARLSVGPLLKELGKGGAVGGAFTALTEFLDHSNQQQQRDLDARAGLGSIAGIAGEDLLKELGKGAAVGGAFSALADLLNKQSKPSKRSDDLEARQVAGEVVEDGLKDLLGKNVANGIGSALGATAVGGAIEHFFGHKNSRDLSDSDLLHILSELHASGPDLVARTPLNLGDIGKAILGSGISFGAASAAQPLVNKIEKIFRRGQGDFDFTPEFQNFINDHAITRILNKIPVRELGRQIGSDHFLPHEVPFKRNSLDDFRKAFQHDFAGLKRPLGPVVPIKSDFSPVFPTREVIDASKRSFDGGVSRRDLETLDLRSLYPEALDELD